MIEMAVEFHFCNHSLSHTYQTSIELMCVYIP